MRVLPRPPAFVLSRAETTLVRSPFVEIVSHTLVAEHPTEGPSEPFGYEMVTRRALDAVIIAAHRLENGRRCVYLRSALRPPLAFRGRPPELDFNLWELPAGLVEPGEAFAEAAARELFEETGIACPNLASLGHPVAPAPGLIGELHVFFHAEVEPPSAIPPGDETPLERGAAIVLVPLDDALRACKSGEVLDAKTELGLRRLAEVV